jgi:hypothetical protein
MDLDNIEMTMADFWIAQDRDGDPIAKIRIDTNYKRPDLVYRFIVGDGVKISLPFEISDVSDHPLGPKNVFFLRENVDGSALFRKFSSRPEVADAISAGETPLTKCRLTRLGINKKGDRQGYVSFDLELNYVKTDVYAEIKP